MKLDEIKTGDEPFVIPMLKALLKGKKEVQLVLFNADDTKTWMGKIIRTYRDENSPSPAWILDVFTNKSVDYVYGVPRLNRSDIRQLARNRFESTVHALCIPASSNKTDLSEATETEVDGEWPMLMLLIKQRIDKGEEVWTTTRRTSNHGSDYTVDGRAVNVRRVSPDRWMVDFRASYHAENFQLVYDEDTAGAYDLVPLRGAGRWKLERHQPAID